MTEKKTRRHGKELEAAILATVWQQLNTVGYEQMTMNEIAKASHTNKNTVYRRWNNKAEVVFSAIQANTPEIVMQHPDTGSLRGDLVSLFSSLQPLLDSMSTENWTALLADAVSATTTSNLFQTINSANYINTPIPEILANAIQRGEPVRKNLTERQKNLPALLFLTEILTTSRLSSIAIEAMIDEVLLPIFLA